ncbi:SdiA-regulated domain-containing protein [Aquimarina sp. AU474]|uniref:SdiA-regulated domain-containing protein n=1 Tax=Aquimarina sp. AU474 TaxID=2108529 RepID=UPI000D69B146|nr:SdiA-regulated domain-containing protein [Aquimarina sp. AU474]
MLGIKEIKVTVLLYLMTLATFTVSCQKSEKTKLKRINTLSNHIGEISGITSLSKNQLFAINDSGNENILFQLNQEGEIIAEIKIPGTKNIDWEDLAYDHENNIYIGDFGNNANDRKNLVIYKVSGILSNQIAVSEIRFSLEDQKKFPPKKKNLNYDIEAFIYADESFYLFTKNRSSKFKGTTKLYKLAATPGTHTAKIIGTYNTCNDSSDCFITSATINKTKDKIALLTYNKLFIISDFQIDNVFEGSIQKIRLGHYSQKEGVCFKNDSVVFITDEKTKHKKAKLYEYPLD